MCAVPPLQVFNFGIGLYFLEVVRLVSRLMRRLSPDNCNNVALELRPFLPPLVLLPALGPLPPLLLPPRKVRQQSLSSLVLASTPDIRL